MLECEHDNINRRHEATLATLPNPFPSPADLHVGWGGVVTQEQGTLTDAGSLVSSTACNRSPPLVSHNRVLILIPGSGVGPVLQNGFRSAASLGSRALWMNAYCGEGKKGLQTSLNGVNAPPASPHLLTPQE